MNLLCWKNVVTQPAKVAPFVDTVLQDWREATTVVFQRVQGVSFGHPPRLLYWLRPPPDCFKYNVDAAISSDWNVIVLAAIIHGDQESDCKVAIDALLSHSNRLSEFGPLSRDCLALKESFQSFILLLDVSGCKLSR
ncbi:hypothetical protein PVK06_045804 [Gossypium arboreum]|uniref:Uncharacterized protein n=1 Tax=Gossypium arboreum TaxID=29729 RepID=A0ABR0MV31_GOSAR|nr:hypothetical protein PVK06_045804 [Gossypium arboreum]